MNSVGTSNAGIWSPKGQQPTGTVKGYKSVRFKPGLTSSPTDFNGDGTEHTSSTFSGAGKFPPNSNFPPFPVASNGFATQNVSINSAVPTEKVWRPKSPAQFQGGPGNFNQGVNARPLQPPIIRIEDTSNTHPDSLNQPIYDNAQLTNTQPTANNFTNQVQGHPQFNYGVSVLKNVDNNRNFSNQHGTQFQLNRHQTQPGVNSPEFSDPQVRNIVHQKQPVFGGNQQQQQFGQQQLKNNAQFNHHSQQQQQQQFNQQQRNQQFMSQPQQQQFNQQQQHNGQSMVQYGQSFAQQQPFNQRNAHVNQQQYVHQQQQQHAQQQQLDQQHEPESTGIGANQFSKLQAKFGSSGSNIHTKEPSGHQNEERIQNSSQPQSDNRFIFKKLNSPSEERPFYTGNEYQRAEAQKHNAIPDEQKSTANWNPVKAFDTDQVDVSQGKVKLSRPPDSHQDEKLQSEVWWNSFLQDTTQPPTVSFEKVVTSSSRPQNIITPRSPPGSTRKVPEVLQEWRSGLYDERPSGRSSVDLYEQLKNTYQHSSTSERGPVKRQNSDPFSREHQRQPGGESQTFRIDKVLSTAKQSDKPLPPVKPHSIQIQPIKIEATVKTEQQPGIKNIDPQLRPYLESAEEFINQNLLTHNVGHQNELMTSKTGSKEQREVPKYPASHAALPGNQLPETKGQNINRAFLNGHILNNQGTRNLSTEGNLPKRNGGLITDFEEQRPTVKHEQFKINYENTDKMKANNSVQSAAATGGSRSNNASTGPTVETTGLELMSGNSMEDRSRKEWYQEMYETIHKPDTTTSDDLIRNANPPLWDIQNPSRTQEANENKTNLYPSHAKYSTQQYRNQPMKIEDYEPGSHSSLALQSAKRKPNAASHNVYAESDTEANYGSSDKQSALLSPTYSDMGDMNRYQKYGRAKGSRYATVGRDMNSRPRPDEQRRRDEIERVMDEERLRRFVQEQKLNQQRRHTDTLTPMQKSTILLNRFNEDFEDDLERPIMKCPTRIRGKAKALYTFRAQNNRELSFKRGDSIYILKQIDKNWFKGELHGVQGIFPVNYVQVSVSLEDARAAALEKEGQAVVNYNFAAQTPAELSLRKGDIIQLIKRIDENWYEGRVGNRQGIFPVSYVECSREPNTPLMTPMSSLAPTPIPGTPGRMSPTSSACSVLGPEVPSAPLSPWAWDTDFYDSEFEESRAKTPINVDVGLSSTSDLSGYSPQAASKPHSTQLLLSVPNQSSQSTSQANQFIQPAPPSTVTSQRNNLLSQQKKYSASLPDDTMNLDDLEEFLKSLAVDRSVTPIEVDTGPPQTISKPPEAVPVVYQKPPIRPTTLGSREGMIRGRPTGSSASSPGGVSSRPPSGLRSEKRLQIGSSSEDGRGNGRSTPTPKDVSSFIRGGDNGIQLNFSKPMGSTNYSRYRVLYDYNPTNIDELQLRIGDVVNVIEKCDDGWYVGVSEKSNKFGTFPGNYVRPL